MPIKIPNPTEKLIGLKGKTDILTLAIQEISVLPAILTIPTKGSREHRKILCELQ